MKLELVAAGDSRFRDWMRRYREEITGEPPSDAWLNKYLEALFADQGKRRFIWWAIDSSRRVGFAVAVVSKHWADSARTVGQIGEFFIYPEFRREGLGRRMAQAIIEWLRTNGADEIQSGVVAGNLRGLRFWEAVGFQIARYSLIYNPNRPREPEEDE
ncbi:MAG: GNAT family N-acetyltransferase [Armatimonadetes bacterium]|nr:GNAT family N-acetyltransferase [Armatimonadota bacterium]